VAERVGTLLEGGLTRQRAVAIALVNNRSLRETYDELGVSQAEMVEAGLLENPTLSLDVGFPLSGGVPEFDASLVQNFLSLFVLPARKRIAAEQFDADVKRVAHEALGVAAEVSQALVAVQASEQLVGLRRTVLEAAEAAAQLSEKLYRAGNVPELAYVSERAAYEQAKLELARGELALTEHREELNRLLGLWGPQTGWKLAEQLPELPAEEAKLEHLESFAVRERLDLAAARGQAQVMARAASLARSTRYLGVLEVGVDYHRDPDGPRVVGPTLSLTLPLFNRRGPVIARLEALARQAESRLAGLGVEVRSQVRVARARLAVARQVVEHYRKVLLPLRERIVELSQLHYNGMDLSPVELLSVKAQQVEGYRSYFEALEDYWKARAQLERAVGGKLPPTAPSQEPAR
jgi:cobalt-zinc-cadmium efflux system outer membrane protein